MTDIERATYWASLTPKQRKAFIKSSQQLTTTSNQRMTGVRSDIRKAGQA